MDAQITMTYYAVLLRCSDGAVRYWFYDFPQSPVSQDTHLHEYLKSLVLEYFNQYHTFPIATGIYPLLHKIKRLVNEGGRSTDDLLRCRPVTVTVSPQQDTKYTWEEQ